MHQKQTKKWYTQKKENKCVNILKHCKKWLSMLMLQNKTKNHNPNYPQTPDHPYRILVIWCSGYRYCLMLWIMIVLLLIKFIYMSRIQMNQISLFHKKHENCCLENLKDSKALK